MVVVVAFVAVYCGYKFGNVSVTRTARKRMHFPQRNGFKAIITPAQKIWHPFSNLIANLMQL